MTAEPIHTTHQDIIKRLKRASGHLKSVIGMIEAGRPCLDIAQQPHAVEKAITQAIPDHERPPSSPPAEPSCRSRWSAWRRDLARGDRLGLTGMNLWRGLDTEAVVPYVQPLCGVIIISVALWMICLTTRTEADSSTTTITMGTMILITMNMATTRAAAGMDMSPV